AAEGDHRKYTAFKKSNDKRPTRLNASSSLLTSNVTKVHVLNSTTLENNHL
ncbi:hypothetical protein V5799_025091, partial [Amblyomma americanum]